MGIDAVPFPICGSYNNQRIKNIDAERSVNVFYYRDSLGKKDFSLLSTSGLTNTGLVFPGATGGFRAEFIFNANNKFVVIGSSVYLINSSNTISFLGSLITTVGYVAIDANNYQVIFVDGINGFIFDLNALTFIKISDTSFPLAPIDVCYLDGLFTVANGNTNTFQLCLINQGMVWGTASNPFTVNTSNSYLAISSSSNYATGIPVSVDGTTLPSPLDDSSTYYTIKIDATHIQLASSYANAISGTYITLTTTGGSDNVITSDGQLQLGSITTHPGTIVACRTLHRRVFLFSQNFTEVWENAGVGTNLPFRRNNSLLMEYGTPAIGSIAVSFDKMFFLSQTKDGLGSVMEVQGAQAVPVSPKSLNSQLSEYAALSNVSDCRAFLIRENGLIFYRMNFTAANHTFVYNETESNPESQETMFWHEEEVLNGDRHPAQTHAYFNGINFVGHYALPILYIVDPRNSTNDGESIRRMRISRPISNPKDARRRIDRFFLDLPQGNLQIQQGNYSVFLSVSKDGGQTYGPILRQPIGAVGNRAFRTVWRKLGVVPRGQAFIVKIEFYAPVPFTILGASWTSEVLPQ